MILINITITYKMSLHMVIMLVIIVTKFTHSIRKFKDLFIILKKINNFATLQDTYLFIYVHIYIFIKMFFSF